MAVALCFVGIFTAAGDATAAAIAGALQGVAAGLSWSAAVEDVRPPPEGDPHGLAPFFLVAGLVIASVAFQALLFLLARQAALGPQMGAACAYAFLAGVLGAATSTAVTGGWRHTWAVAGIGMLLCLAVVFGTAALQRLCGLSEMGLAVLVLVMLGNSTAGGAVGSPFLPDGFRQLSRNLPTGAAVTAVRNAVYFDGAALGRPLLALVAWAALGVTVVVGAGLRPNRRGRAGPIEAVDPWP